MVDRRPLIAGNWKMNGLMADGVALARAIGDRAATAGRISADLLVCPPATLLAPVAGVLRGGVALGGQDCHPDPAGAHTGDISAEMLADIGCRFVVVGHSERRADHGESDDRVRAKAAAVRRAGLTAIICIGETEAERDRGQALDVIRRQLAGSLPDAASARDVVVAYEPVWAIGTGRTATPSDVAEAHAAIRATLAQKMSDADHTRILYGGSVKPENAADLLRVKDVDGALVGGASLKADDFWAIVQACD